MPSSATVFLVDSDVATCNVVRDLASTMNLRCEVYASGDDFLAAYDTSRPGCVILGLRIPGAGGMQIQQFLNSDKNGHPVIFLTAHADLSIAVEAMRAGAVNFLLKPVHSGELWNSIEEAIALDGKRRRARAWHQKLADRLRSLTPREREVLCMIGQGKGTREIASSLEVSLRSVQKHRAGVARKLGASSLWELVDVGLHAAQDGGQNGDPGPWPGPNGRRLV